MSIYEPPEGFVYQRGWIDWWWGWSPVSDLKAQPADESDSSTRHEGGPPWYGTRNQALESLVDHALTRIRADGR